MNTWRDATHNHRRANLREAEIAHGSKPSLKQTSENDGTVQHKTNWLERRLLAGCSGGLKRTNRKVWHVRNLTEREEHTCRSAEVGSEAVVKQVQDEATCT